MASRASQVADAIAAAIRAAQPGWELSFVPTVQRVVVPRLDEPAPSGGTAMIWTESLSADVIADRLVMEDATVHIAAMQPAAMQEAAKLEAQWSWAERVVELLAGGTFAGAVLASATWGLDTEVPATERVGAISITAIMRWDHAGS